MTATTCSFTDRLLFNLLTTGKQGAILEEKIVLQESAEGRLRAVLPFVECASLGSSGTALTDKA